MSKKGTKALASATLMSLVLTTALSAGPVKAAAGQATRVGAADRYATAAQVATTNWKTSENVVLVSGDGYADAVSASALAKKLDAPILLTTAKSLSTDTKDALSKLGAKNVYVVGGEASVSTAVRSELKKTYSLVELGGANRYETNVKVAEKLVELGVKADEVIMVGGEGFSDALSVAPVAAAQGKILLLGMSNADYMKPVLDFVAKNNSKVTVVGTKNVISDTILNTVKGTRVDGGKDRWDTNQKVLAAFKDTVKMDKLYVASAAYNAQDNGYADALVASALAGKFAAPLVLVDKDGNEGTTNALNYIKNNAKKTTDLQVVGGTGVVSDSLLGKITEQVTPVKPGPKGDNKVAEINPISLNQFDIVFDTNVDEDTAELASNYKVGGTQLTDSNSHMELINDNTVRVTLVRAEFKNINQGDEKTVSVKKGILTSDKSQTIETFDKKIEFRDVKEPTLKSVTVRGNNKLVVEFSEAVNMSSLSKVAALIKVDGKTLSNYNTTYSEIKEAATNKTETWSSKVEFYLNSGLDSGDITVKVKDADNGVLVDAAGFSFKETEEKVTVDKVSTQPEIKDITCTDDGEIRVIFDRAMDGKIKVDKYTGSDIKINDQSISGAKLALKENDTVIKITNVPDGILKDNTNILSINDKIKDAYGNKMDKDTRKSFDKEKDETKPTVLSATIIDSTTLRVQFSEDVKYAYATNIDNYELKDSNDLDLMSKDGIYVKASSDVDEKDKADTDTFDIKLDKTKKTSTTSYKFDSSKYTLTVKKIIDKATEPNKMDDQTLNVDGDNSTAPSVDDIEAFMKKGSTTEVAIYFGTEMDASALNDKANYYYINGDGDSEELPDDVDITVSRDNKSVVLDFDDANKTVNPSATSGDDVVRKIGVKNNIKDASGNAVYVGTLSIAPSSATGPKLEANTFKLYKDGDDVKADLQLDCAMDTVNPDDFKVSGIVADDADPDGDKITLTFNDGDKADAVLALGSSAELQINPVATDPSEDIAGRAIAAATQKVYYNKIAPETDRDNYKATVTVDGSGNVTDAHIYITMKTPVDTSILGSYKDDFVLVNSSKGKNLDVESVKQEKINGQYTLVFTIKDAAKYVASGNKIDITASTDKDDIDIRSEEDVDGENAKFVPSSDDIKVKTVTVSSTTQTTVDKSSLKSAIATAEAKVEGDYTVESWSAMKTKLTAAKAVNDDSSATQAQVNTAATELTNAVKALAPKGGVVIPDYTVTATASPDPSKTIIVVALPEGTDTSKYVVKIGGNVVTANGTKYGTMVSGSYTNDTAKALVSVELAK